MRHYNQVCVRGNWLHFVAPMAVSARHVVDTVKRIHLCTACNVPMHSDTLHVQYTVTHCMYTVHSDTLHVHSTQ